MNRKELLKECINKLEQQLDGDMGFLDLSTDDLKSLKQFITNPVEFQIIDTHAKKPIDKDLYNTMLTKYPEEFI